MNVDVITQECQSDPFSHMNVDVITQECRHTPHYALNKVVLKKLCFGTHIDTILHHMVYFEQCALYLEALMRS